MSSDQDDSNTNHTNMYSRHDDDTGGGDDNHQERIASSTVNTRYLYDLPPQQQQQQQQAQQQAQNPYYYYYPYAPTNISHLPTTATTTSTSGISNNTATPQGTSQMFSTDPLLSLYPPFIPLPTQLASQPQPQQPQHQQQALPHYPTMMSQLPTISPSISQQQTQVARQPLQYQHQHQRQPSQQVPILPESPYRSPQQRRRAALMSTPSGARVSTKNIHRHKKHIENLSISSGLNTVHIKDEDLPEHEELLLPASLEEGSPSKKQRVNSTTTVEKKDLNEQETLIKNEAIKSMEQRIELDQFAKQLKITRPDIDASTSKSKSNSKNAHDREKNRSIFAIRCFYECFTSTREQLPLFQSKILHDAINSIDFSLLSNNPVSSASADVSGGGGTGGNYSSQITRGGGIDKSAGATARSMTYSSYMLLCDYCDVEYMGQSGIGKLIRVAFPELTTRRLGIRGNSKYHYIGMTPKPWIKELIDLYENGHLVTRVKLEQSPSSSMTLIPPPGAPAAPVTPPQLHQEPRAVTVASASASSVVPATTITSASGENKRSSLIKSDHIFPHNFKMTNLDINDTLITDRLYNILVSGDISRLDDFISKLNVETDLAHIFHQELLYLSPLSYQLGSNTVLNNLNYLSLSNGHLTGSLSIDDQILRFFLLILGRLIKASRCSLSLSNMLYLYHSELANNLQTINVQEIIMLEVDDIRNRSLFNNFFTNLERFLAETIPELLERISHEEPVGQEGQEGVGGVQQESKSTSIHFISQIFPKENRSIMENLVEFLIEELKKFESKNLRFLILSFSKILTSLTDEILRNSDLSMNFNNWWILNCWMNEWLNFCCELIAFEKENVLLN